MRASRHLSLASLLPASVLFAACAEAPPAQPQNPGVQATVYQQQAGYANEASAQATAAPAATALGNAPGPWGIPGLVEIAPRSVPDAVAQLDRAEQLLGFVLTARPGDARKTPVPGSPGGSVGAESEAPVPLGDPCLIACAALASMKRSADHVCSMAGEGDAMCGTARSRVQRAEQRVTASCPACSAGK